MFPFLISFAGIMALRSWLDWQAKKKVAVHALVAREELATVMRNLVGPDVPVGPADISPILGKAVRFGAIDDHELSIVIQTIMMAPKGSEDQAGQQGQSSRWAKVQGFHRREE